MAAVPQQTMTPQEYLDYERASDQRHEYLAGVVYQMAGGSESHNLIISNIIAALHTQLRQRPCTVYPSDMRLKVARTGLYTYPDVTVVCGERQFEDDTRDTLLNPVVIIEVLSPSTENYDRGKKSQYYRTLDSLQEYLLVAQDAYHIEHYLRQPDASWRLTDVNGQAAVVSLVSIGCILSLNEVYEKVTFESG